LRFFLPQTDTGNIFTSIGRLPFNMREMSGKITGMLTRAAADFPNGGWLRKNCTNDLQNGIFIIFTGLGKRFMGHVFDSF
jgi:hypothetical protein